jgi:CheY-like chemotaxis protein
MKTKKLSFNKAELEKITRTTPYRVLVMDDDKQVQNLVKAILKESEFEYDVAANGTEAIELFEKAKTSENPFDVLYS